jgi:hypothetical protein
MTKKKPQQRKQVAPKAPNKAKASSSRAPPKKTRNDRKRPASDISDDSSSDEGHEVPKKPHAHSCKKAKKGVEEEIEVEEMKNRLPVRRSVTWTTKQVVGLVAKLPTMKLSIM